MKKSGMIALLLTAVMLLGGCAGDDENKILYEKANKTKISFSWWGNDERHMYTKNGLELFEKENSDIEVSQSYGVWDIYEKRNRIAMEANIATDVMLINYSWLGQYSSDGEGYYDLNELSDYIDLSQFSEEDLAIGTINGHLNALPTAYNCSVIYFNKDLFEFYGLEVPRTWNDLFKAAKVMSKDGIYPLGAVKKHLFLLLMAYFEQVNGKPLFNSDGVMIASQEEMERLMEFYRRLLDEKVLMPIDNFNTNSLGNEEVAGAAFWISDATRYCQPLLEKGAQVVEAEPLGIRDTDNTGWYMKPATMYAISRDTDAPEAAARLVNFLLNSPEMALYQGTEKGVPVSKIAYRTLEEKNKLNSLESTATIHLNERKGEMKLFLPIMEDNEIIEGFKKSGDKYRYGQQTLRTSAQEVIRLIRTRQ